MATAKKVAGGGWGSGAALAIAGRQTQFFRAAVGWERLRNGDYGRMAARKVEGSR